MKADDLFYVCIYKKGEEFVGHHASQVNEFEDSLEKQKIKIRDLDEKKLEQNENIIKNIFGEYCNSLISYIDILPLIASLTPTLTYGLRSKKLIDFLNDKSSSYEDNSGRIILNVPVRYFDEFKSISDGASKAHSVGRQIPKMLIIGIVSSYEHHLSLIIREILRKNPGRLAASDRQVSVKDVFDSGDIESFKEQVLDKEIDIIMRCSFEEQVSWIEKAVGIRSEIKADYGDWPKLVEIFERRNLFTHANGFINDRYLKKAKKLNFPKRDGIVKGHELLAGPRYFKEALETICEFGIKITQVCWRKIENGNEKIADDALCAFGFEFIERGRYNLAIKIFEFFFSLSGKKEEERRLVSLVNLANAYKLNGDSKKAEKLLDKEDWSVVNDNFRISVMAVREDCDEVIRLMKRMGASCDFGERAYEEWPVFFHVRDDDRFRNTFEEIFGRKYSPAPKKRRGILELMGREESVGEEDEKTLKNRRLRTRKPEMVASPNC